MSWACGQGTRDGNFDKETFLKTHLEDRYSDWLRAGRPRGRSSSPGRSKNFSFLHVVQTGSGAHPVSYPAGTGGSFPGGKAAGA
jgi:hypothetical protein